MIDKSKNMRIKKELKSYISTFDDKVSDKENEEIANILLEKYNTDKDFKKKVEKISKKLQSSTSTSKKGGRRKTRKKQKGGLSDEAIAIIAGAIILTTGLVSVFAYGIQRYMNFRERGADLDRQREVVDQLRTSSSDDDMSQPRTPPRIRRRRGLQNPRDSAFHVIRPHSAAASSVDLFSGQGHSTAPSQVQRAYSNETGRLLQRNELADQYEYEQMGLGTPLRPTARGNPQDRLPNPDDFTEENIIPTPAGRRIGASSVRGRPLSPRQLLIGRPRNRSAPAFLGADSTSSDEDYDHRSDARQQLQERRGSDSDSDERPRTNRHHSAGGGRKRKTLRKRKKRRKKITIKRK